MPSQPAFPATTWSDPLLKVMAELRSQQGDARGTLAPQQRDDLDKLDAAGGKLQTLLRTPPQDDFHHDLLNILGAMRGYAELIIEDLGADLATLSDTLNRLLNALMAADDGLDYKSANRATMLVSEPGTILAVDDTAENRDLLQRYLTRAGHRVILASSGAEALQQLALHDIDVVLLDLVMPGMDGSEVLNQIKAYEEWRPIPVIIISGRQDMNGVIDCIEAGADDYLFKPFNPVLLQARIKAGLERKRWHDREQQYRDQLERNERFIRATFGRYLSDEIVADLLESPEGLKLGGDLREVTILMSDIRGFSTLSEQMPPQQVMAMLNVYLGTMTDIIMQHRGTIDEFIGDAILAIFGAPLSRDDDVDRAVQCALAMQQAMTQINAENLRQGLPEISMGVAVNTGTVIAGNIGSERRSKYGVVGHNVNLTARIEEHTAGGEILVSQSTLDKLHGRYSIGRHETVQVKGIHQSVDIYQILEASP